MGLPRREQWLLVQAFLALPLMGLGLWLLGLRRLQTLLSHWPLRKPGGALGEKSFSAAQRHARGVEAAARHGLYRATCLPRSLALWWLLRCHGLEADLRIGVKLVDRRLAAHAWVELQGQPLNEVPDVRRHFSAFAQAIAP
jgi:hypothetical protein